jgi:hypothetical protein
MLALVVGVKFAFAAERGPDFVSLNSGHTLQLFVTAAVQPLLTGPRQSAILAHARENIMGGCREGMVEIRRHHNSGLPRRNRYERSDARG